MQLPSTHTHPTHTHIFVSEDAKLRQAPPPFLLPLPQPGGAFLEQRGDDQAVHVALPEVDVERDGHLLPVPPGKRQGVGTCEKGARSVLCEEPHGEKRSRVQHGTVQSSTV